MNSNDKHVTTIESNTLFEFNDSLEKAVHLHNQGHLNKATACYRGLLEKCPENPDLWNLLGVAAHQSA